jgi:hypothetical protein
MEWATAIPALCFLQTAGLSGSDINIAIQDALMQPVKRSRPPSTEDDPGATPMN